MKEFYTPGFKCSINSFVTAFKQKIENEYRFPGEMHDFWEMVYIYEGKATVSEDDRVYELESGHVIFHKPMEFHKIWVEKNDYARMLVISFHADETVFSDLGAGVFKVNAEMRDAINEAYSLIEENFSVNFYVERKDEPNPVGEKIGFMQFEILLLSLLSEKTHNHSRQSSAGAMNYKLVLDIMNENADKNLSISEIAALCNLGESNIKKIFAKYSDGGVMKHYNRIKIKKAMRLLRAGHSVANTSYMLGFLNPSYFAVVFKRETGELPSQYRQSFKEK